MDGRKALLKRLASVTDWDQTTRAAFEGECWVETRNTIYRFRDGVCFQVANRDPRKKGRASALVGMRLVGWVSETRSESEREWHSRLGYEWTEGAAALLWRPQGEAGDEAMAMTSRTTAFTAGRSSSCLQAMHDQAPPPDSQLLRRVVASSPPFAAGRPPMPSHVSG
jgi:hypothetical protein